jgi:hypothetical protein
MKKHVIIPVIMFVIISLAAAAYLLLREPSYITPERFKGASYQSARDIVLTGDGYILAGMASPSGGGNIEAYLLKLDKYGKKVWENVFGAGHDDRLFCVINNSDGGYSACGYTYTMDGTDSGFLLVCTDIKGNLVFSKNFMEGYKAEAYSMLQLADGGYMVVGNYLKGPKNSKSTRQSVLMVKTDHDGNKVWTNTINAARNISANCIIRSGDGGYILAGSSDSYGPGRQDMAMIKVDAKGNTLWIRNFGGKSSDTGSRVVAAENGGYALIGSTGTGEGSSDIYLVKTDSDGKEEWSKTYGGDGIDQGVSVINSGDGGFIIGANTESFSRGSSDLFVIKVDMKGGVVWSHNYGGDKDDYMGNIVLTLDKGIAAAGWSGSGIQGNYDVYFFKSDKMGLF